MFLRKAPRLVTILAGGLALATSLVVPVEIAGAGTAGTIYPEPGTYELYKIQKAPSGWVVEDSYWRPHRLSSYLNDKITLFTFFYTNCNDLQGCPVAWLAFQNVQDEIKKDPKLHGRVRLVFLTLDPNVDTPERLKMFAHSFGDAPKVAPWHFLTTWSNSFLTPIIADSNQTASRELDDKGKPTDVINHMIKVYLVDEKQWVREIYTTAFLDPQVMLNDIRTLAIEGDQENKRTN